MKKFVDESWFAKNFLFSGFLAITLGPVAFCKKVFTQRTKNHEATHMRQWAEWTILSFIVFTILSATTPMNAWWGLCSVGVYYALYILEWFIRLFTNPGNAYRAISFEQEAYAHEMINTYNTNSSYFGNFKYLFRKFKRSTFNQ